MKELTKYQFKVCEAVTLGMTHYYMGPKDKRALKQEDYDIAYRLLPKLTKGWMQESYDWQVFGKFGNSKKELKKGRNKR